MKKKENLKYKVAIACFWIDAISKTREGDFIECDETGIFDINLWGSPNLIDKRIRYAVGQPKINKLFKEYIDWIGEKVTDAEIRPHKIKKLRENI